MQEAPPLLGTPRICPLSLPLASPRKRRGWLGVSGDVYLNIFAVGCPARELVIKWRQKQTVDDLTSSLGSGRVPTWMMGFKSSNSTA